MAFQGLAKKNPSAIELPRPHVFMKQAYGGRPKSRGPSPFYRTLTLKSAALSISLTATPLDGEGGCHIGYPGPQEAMGAYAPSHAIESSIEPPITPIALGLWGLIGPMKVSNIRIRRPHLKRRA